MFCGEMSMKLLLYDMGAYTQLDIMETLTRMGIAYKNIMYKLQDLHEDAYFEKRIRQLIEEDTYDAVFSINYYPILARICQDISIAYLSWSYDSPINVSNIEETLGYQTNYVFFFDKAECRKYWSKGYRNVYHMPLAVNPQRLDEIALSNEDGKKYRADISMVGQLYNSFLPVLMEPLDKYDKGYLNAIIEAQLKLYGCYILDKVITEELVGRMNTAYAALGQESFLLNKEGLIVTVAKHITHLERIIILDILSEKNQIHLYGAGSDETLSHVIWHGSAGYFDEMPRIFKLSKVNLNVSLKCIQSGIPLRALDIMGCGGFLLTNYQPEIAEYFIDGEELVMYSCLEEAVEKCQYYLEHDSEREQIAKKGYQKICESFKYEDRLRAMFKTAGFPV